MTGPEPAAGLVDGVDVDAVQVAVSACGGVARVGSGTLAAAATYLPGRRVAGIRVNADSVELELVAEWGAVAGDIGRDVRVAVAALVGGRRVDVTIADIELPAAPAAVPAVPAVSGVGMFPSVVVPPGR